jgi:hypothetical protein
MFVDDDQLDEKVQKITDWLKSGGWRLHGERASAVYKYAALFNSWTIEEAAALFRGADPAFVQPRFSDRLPDDVAKRFAADCALLSRVFGETVAPDELMTWTRKHGIELPEELVSALTPQQSTTRSGQTKYDNTSNKIIYGLAVACFGHRPGARGTASKIVNRLATLATHQIAVDEETVSKRLIAGEENADR